LIRFWLVLAALSLPAQTYTELYCTGCHNPHSKAGGLNLSDLDPARAGEKPGVWERVLRQVRTGAMPPAGIARPPGAPTAAFVRSLTATLDRTPPDPGAPAPHRLNRAEYSNAIRDLLALDTQPGLHLPVDESGYGFDNMADLLSMSPALLERYLSVARRVTRQAIGDLNQKPGDLTFGSVDRGSRRSPSAEQLPLGASGGLAFSHYFPLDADYEFRVALVGTTGEGAPPTPYVIKLPVRAGLHRVTVTFPRDLARAEAATRTFGRVFGGAPAPAGPPLDMDLRIDGASVKRWEVRPRGNAPDVATLILGGPHNRASRGATPSRQAIFVCAPKAANEETECADRIVTRLATRAFRRPVTAADTKPLLGFFEGARKQGAGFEDAIGSALEAILVSPDFLFRVERTPANATGPFTISGHELASRLSFFLWSSIPDDELLRLADNGQLRTPAVLRAQVDRMLADPKSGALAKNFAGQWLQLRTLANTKPDAEIFSSFDENLRAAYTAETELFVNDIFRNGRNVLDLLGANFTYLNQQLAEQYGVRNVYGSHFRRVEVADGRRGGLLGQGGILTVTSYPNRTSVVQRGKWILENLLGTPPPPPPPDVPELAAKSNDGRKLSLREAMDKHRANAICRSCHARMDPIGFALENFDGVGSWRDSDAGVPVDAKGTLPNGASFEGPAGLKKLLVDRHGEEFVQTFVEKLMTYALGRGLEPADQPVVRAIMRKASAQGNKVPAFVAAIVESVPFQMRRPSEK